MEAIEEIERVMPGQFKYYLYKDVGRTSRLEMTVCKNSKELTEEGELVFSMASGKKFPRDDLPSMIEMVKAAI